MPVLELLLLLLSVDALTGSGSKVCRVAGWGVNAKGFGKGVYSEVWQQGFASVIVAYRDIKIERLMSVLIDWQHNRAYSGRNSTHGQPSELVEFALVEPHISMHLAALVSTSLLQIAMSLVGRALLRAPGGPGVPGGRARRAAATHDRRRTSRPDQQQAPL